MSHSKFWLVVLTTVILFLGSVVVYDVLNLPHFGPIMWSEKQDYAAPPLSDEDKAAVNQILIDETPHHNGE